VVAENPARWQFVAGKKKAMSKQEAYEQATLKNLSDPTGTRQDIIYAAMEIYAEEKYKDYIKVKIEFCENIPDEEQKYLASIDEGDYKGTIVTAESVAECFRQLGTSIMVLDDFRKRVG
jgi:hypothetical protein